MFIFLVQRVVVEDAEEHLCICWMDSFLKVFNISVIFYDKRFSFFAENIQLLEVVETFFDPFMSKINEILLSVAESL